MKDLINKNKLYILIGIVVVFLFVLLLNIKYNKIDNKTYKNLNLVFKMNNFGKNYMPYININTNEINNLNKEIVTFYYQTINNSKNSFIYNSKIVDNVVQVLIKTKEYDTSNTFYNEKYLVYYINTDTNKIMPKSEFIHKFSINDNITNKINSKLHNIYEKNINEGYLEKEVCDYECFLEINNINSLNDNLVYYIDDNNINVYLNYNKENIWFDPDDYISIDTLYKFKR